MLLDEVAELDVETVVPLDSVNILEPLDPNGDLFQDLEVAPRIIEEEVDTEGLF
jgi:hypothetical protein